MRILIVGPIHHAAEYTRARRDAAARGEPLPLFPPGYPFYFYAEALRAQGHEMEVFHFTAGALFGGRQWVKLGGKVRAGLQRFPRLSPEYMARNRRLAGQARAFEPDWVWLIGGSNLILPETLAGIKAQGAKLAFFSGTSPVVFALPNERKAAPLFDLAATNDFYHAMQWLELGAARAEALPYAACEPSYHRPYALSAEERAAYGCDVAFVGTLTPPNLYSRRVRALEALRDFDLGVWSVHPVPASLQPFYRGGALGEKMLRITCAAKIAVNPHGDFMRWGGNMRLFEAAGCRVFQIADEAPGVPEWFTPGEEIVLYRDPDHLRELAAYYLAHDAERERIAAAGQARVYTDHTYAQRTARLLTLMENS
ncbi:MAG: glycosyltransferase [Anaerolineae bacterium]|nr:glycosyltransferase [Anaerolineae bacterium]